MLKKLPKYIFDEMHVKIYQECLSIALEGSINWNG